MTGSSLTDRGLARLRRLRRRIDSNAWGRPWLDPKRLGAYSHLGRTLSPVRSPEASVSEASASQVPPKEAGTLRLFSLNVAHGRRTAANKPFLRRRTAQRNLGQIAQAVRVLTPDVVALQEADGPSSWSGNFDHVATLAEQTDLVDHYRGEHNPFQLGRLRLSSGTALLANQPLRDPSSHRFAVSWRDTKGFVVATLTVPEWGGAEIDIVSVHLDFLIPRVRRQQILQLAERMLPRGRPIVVVGDLNCCWKWEPRSMRLLMETLGLEAHEPEATAPTFPSKRPLRRLDWVLVSRELAYDGYHTLPIPLSDHLGVVADLSLR